MDAGDLSRQAGDIGLAALHMRPLPLFNQFHQLELEAQHLVMQVGVGHVEGRTHVGSPRIPTPFLKGS